MKNPKLLMNVIKIKNIKNLPDSSANAFSNLSIFVLKK